jgi:RNA polymerase sigma factor for flagellar operon FliA
MYTKTGALDQDAAVRKYAGMVRRMAHHLLARLPASVELDDMIQAGMMGLMDALTRYEDTHGAQFETYAAQRIRGAMLDGLREHDWLPRGVRRAQRRIDKAMQALEHRLGRMPGETEIAQQLEVSLEEYRHLLLEARGAQLVFYEDLSEGGEGGDFFERNVPDPGLDPLARLHDKRFRKALVAAIEKLPERERMVMGMYYEKEMNLREIAEVLGVTESRICQLHGQAISRLRSRFKGW